MSTAVGRASPKDGGRATKPGATSVLALLWASPMEQRPYGNGGSIRTSRVMATIFWWRVQVGARRLILREAATWAWSERSWTIYRSPTALPAGTCRPTLVVYSTQAFSISVMPSTADPGLSSMQTAGFRQSTG